MKRRDAIRRAILGGASLTLVPGILTRCEEELEPSVEKPMTLVIDMDQPEYALLKQRGKSMVLSGEIIVANAGADGFIAARCKCPHNGGTLKYNGNNYSEGVWRCTGHGSGFTFDGRCLCGPSPMNLKTFPIFRDSDKLTIYT